MISETEFYDIQLEDGITIKYKNLVFVASINKSDKYEYIWVIINNNNRDNGVILSILSPEFLMYGEYGKPSNTDIDNIIEGLHYENNWKLLIDSINNMKAEYNQTIIDNINIPDYRLLQSVK